MECLWLIVALVAIGLLLSIFNQLRQLNRRTKIIMKTQEEFDAQIAAMKESLDAIPAAIEAEGQQIRDFIAANPGLDTSALDGVVERLGGVAESIGTVFTPTEPEVEAEPEAEPGESNDPNVQAESDADGE